MRLKKELSYITNSLLKTPMTSPKSSRKKFDGEGNKMNLEEILEKHKKWLNDNEEEECADLRGADLSNVNLRDVDLRDADLCGANLCGADLRGANLCGANLCGANLFCADLTYAILRGANLSCAKLEYAKLGNADVRCANLREAILRGAYLCDVNFSDSNLTLADLCGASLCDADLRGTDLHYANLTYANLTCANLTYATLRGVDLRDADLSGANLSGADLREAELENIKVNANTSGYHLVCPEKGTFIGFKKVHNSIIELEIPSEAKRSSATSRKCRCEYAKVLSITNVDGTDSGLTSITNNNYHITVYKVGEIVYPNSFDENRWNECSNGIHFFITRQEAVDY